jgi:hypothetical protein
MSGKTAIEHDPEHEPQAGGWRTLAQFGVKLGLPAGWREWWR